jgi:DUF2934 family protein
MSSAAGRKMSDSRTALTPEEFEERVRAVAYILWLERDCNSLEGSALDDWLEAETQVRREYRVTEEAWLDRDAE